MREELFPLVYYELYRLARAFPSNPRAEHPLQAADLVNEAFLMLCSPSAQPWTDKEHFLRVAAKAMRQVLINDARRRSQAKRSEPDETGRGPSLLQG